MLLRLVLISSLFYTLGCFAQSQNVFNPQAITVAIDKTPVSFNPLADDSVMSQQFKHLLFDPLFRWNKNQQIEARLVKNWERVDSKIVRFHLRENIRFHSGNLLTTNDVIWSFNESKKQSDTSFLNKIEWVKALDQNRFDIKSTLSDIQLLDYLTNLFVLDSNFYQANTNLLDSPPSIILPPIKNLPLSGTGPYLLQQYNPLLGIVVVANQRYWGNPPQTKFFRFMRINKPQSRLFALLADDVQVSYSIPNTSASELAEKSTKNLIKVPSSDVIFLTINDKLSPVLKNRNVRKAIHFAINQQGMLKYILKDNGQVHPSVMSLAENKFSKSNEKFVQIMPEYDLDKAQALLKDLKLPEKLSLLVMLDDLGNSKEVANALTKMLKRVGIKVVTQEISSEEIWRNTSLYYDLTVSTWQSQLMSEDNIYENLFLHSSLTSYLQDKFTQEKITDNFISQSDYFKLLQQDDWIIPLFYQDKIWAQNNQFNLSEIFSSNGIPYWSLFRSNKAVIKPEVEPVTEPKKEASAELIEK